MVSVTQVKKDAKEITKRFAKYFLEAFIVTFSAYLFMVNKTGKTFDYTVHLEYAIIVGLIAASVFAILDNFYPSIAKDTRFGASLGLGLRMVGF